MVNGLWAVYRKELEDHFSSTRFTLLLTVILMVSLLRPTWSGVASGRSWTGWCDPR
jgi:hypothetical protein